MGTHIDAIFLPEYCSVGLPRNFALPPFSHAMALGNMDIKRTPHNRPVTLTSVIGRGVRLVNVIARFRNVDAAESATSTTEEDAVTAPIFEETDTESYTSETASASSWEATKDHDTDNTSVCTSDEESPASLRTKERRVLKQRNKVTAHALDLEEQNDELHKTIKYLRNEITKLKTHRSKDAKMVNQWMVEMERQNESLVDAEEKAGQLESSVSAKNEEVKGLKKQQRKLLQEHGSVKRTAEGFKRERDELLQRADLTATKTTMKRQDDRIEFLNRELASVHRTAQVNAAKWSEQLNAAKDQIRQMVDSAQLMVSQDQYFSNILESGKKVWDRVAEAEQSERYHKKDIQNLLVQMQALSDDLTEMTRKERAARDELIEAQNMVTELQCKSDRSDKTLSEAQKRNEIELDLLQTQFKRQIAVFLPHHSTEVLEILSDTAAAIANREAIRGIIEINLENDELRAELQTSRREKDELQNRFNKADDKLLSANIEEVFLREDLNAARLKLEVLEYNEDKHLKQIARLHEELQVTNQAPGPIGRCNTCLKLRKEVEESEQNCMHLFGKWKPLEDDLNHLRMEHEREKKQLQLRLDEAIQTGNSARAFFNLYWDWAVPRYEGLERRTAHYAKLAGKTYRPEQNALPPNQVVHERRMLAYALQNDEDEDLACLSGLASEARQEGFICSSPTVMALRKLAPELAYAVAMRDKAWIEPTVPILSDLGIPLRELQDDADGFRRRCERIWQEMGKEDELLKQVQDEEMEKESRKFGQEQVREDACAAEGEVVEYGCEDERPEHPPFMEAMAARIAAEEREIKQAEKRMRNSDS